MTKRVTTTTKTRDGFEVDVVTTILEQVFKRLLCGDGGGGAHRHLVDPGEDGSIVLLDCLFQHAPTAGGVEDGGEVEVLGVLLLDLEL